MKNASISIIIPAYNVAGYIEICLESVLAQTYADFEAIVIDDGSTDATGDIADRYALLDSRVKVIHQPNAGVSAARNAGIEAATGEFFLFFDGDDFVERRACGELVGAIRDQEADVVIYGYSRYCDGSVTQTCYPVFSEGLYEGSEIIDGLLPRFVGLSCGSISRWMAGEKCSLHVENPALWRCMARASVIRDNGLAFDTSLKVGEDTIFISDLLSCAGRCFVLHKLYYNLVRREQSAIATYEKDPMAKLEGKKRLLAARLALTDRVRERSGKDIKPYWQGTVVMSVLEMAFLLAKKRGCGMSFAERYRAYLSYAMLGEAMEAVRAIEPFPWPSIRGVPIMMLKQGRHVLLFFCAALLGLIRFRFTRG